MEQGIPWSQIGKQLLRGRWQFLNMVNGEFLKTPSTDKIEI